MKTISELAADHPHQAQTPHVTRDDERNDALQAAYAADKPNAPLKPERFFYNVRRACERRLMRLEEIKAERANFNRDERAEMADLQRMIAMLQEGKVQVSLD